MSKKISSGIPLATGALSALALIAASAPRAEDIDIYTGGSASSTAPNVLFFLDNTSNWSANNQAWSKAGVTAKCNNLPDSQKSICLDYVSQIFGNETSLKQGQVELRALKLVLNELVCKPGSTASVNFGIMMLNDAGSVDGNSVISGYIRHRVAALDSSRCATVLNDLTYIDANISTPAFQGPSSADYGTALFEAFKYFGGWTSPSGAASGTAGSPVGSTGYGPTRYSKPIALEDPLAFLDPGKTTYKSPITAEGACGNNYIVLVGNKFPNQEYGTNTNASPNPTNLLMSRLGYDPGAQLYPKPLKNSDKSDVRFADEWARFLENTDVSSAVGTQKVRTYAVDVYNAQPDAAQATLLQSMAPNGYFRVGGDLYALVKAFEDILTQILAIDSAFVSASLPISANAQGIYKNQVFMGMFRPDAQGKPRWLGNIKQYRFHYDSVAKSLRLVDAAGNPAVSGAGDGFIASTAKSYWTHDSTFWAHAPSGNPPSASDSPDGAIVEKGGAAQILRDTYLSSRANRKVFTCIDCSGLTTLAGNTSAQFVDTNSAINLGAGITDAEKKNIINWVRGDNNAGEAASASGSVRPSIHGDVLHSRPVVVDYGTGAPEQVVVFYGANDGMLHAVNGEQTGPDGGAPLWSFLPQELFPKLKRLRDNSPEIRFHNTPAGSAATPRDYFVDGPISAYQKYNSQGTAEKVHLYIGMRRGGRFLYALDVSTPTDPRFLWKVTSSQIPVLGETWSEAKVAMLKDREEPVLIMGAGYDPGQDKSPADPVAMGNAVLVLDATNGDKLAEFSTTYPVAADATLVDSDLDGYVDRAYVGDLGGNLYRLDLESGETTGVGVWKLTRIAELGRKIFYAPDVVVTKEFTAVMVGTGDREKPLQTDTDNYFITIFDRNTGKGIDGEVSPVSLGSLSAFSESFQLNDSVQGCKLELDSYGEKVVNSPVTVAGKTYFSTHMPKPVEEAAACTADLGKAQAYVVPLFCKPPTVVELDGGGLPPSSVTGIVEVELRDENGNVINDPETGEPESKLVPFIIGGDSPQPPGAQEVKLNVNPRRTRLYWNAETDH